MSNPMSNPMSLRELTKLIEGKPSDEQPHDVQNHLYDWASYKLIYSGEYSGWYLTDKGKDIVNSLSSAPGITSDVLTYEDRMKDCVVLLRQVKDHMVIAYASISAEEVGQAKAHSRRIATIEAAKEVDSLIRKIRS